MATRHAFAYDEREIGGGGFNLEPTAVAAFAKA